MKPKKLRIPAPVHHKASGQDVVFLRDDAGKRRMVYLGEHGSTAAARRYREVLADHLAGKPIATRPKPARQASDWPTVAQLSAAFLLDEMAILPEKTEAMLDELLAASRDLLPQFFD